jgi:hypothetical protein
VFGDSRHLSLTEFAGLRQHSDFYTLWGQIEEGQPDSIRHPAVAVIFNSSDCCMISRRSPLATVNLLLASSYRLWLLRLPNAMKEYKTMPHKMLLGINSKNCNGLDAQLGKRETINPTSGKYRIGVTKFRIISSLLAGLSDNRVQLTANESRKTTMVRIKWSKDINRINSVFLISKISFRLNGL